MTKLLKRPDVERLTSLSRSAIYAAMDEGAFPRPIRVGKRAVRWRQEDIERWLETRPVADPKAAA